ncbi:hypothetical protein QAD02_009664 [Eretmocerus hayati]|uniref:Uncharacterized protein n=1 Tax=Eretmocerus hayati TaxID=131215 RepID=A0ACC2NAC3_9HYME|nr:hypothetical protein QAD02_009664 [Eretmocerus hayati]
MADSYAQELFLFEFLVDKVNIPAVQAMQDDILSVKTCIEFKILNLPPILLCQDSSSDNCCCLGEDPQVFRKGKSCLFALPSRLICRKLCSFPIIMSVYKKLPPSVLPDVMTIGSCSIEARDMINALLDECPLEKPSKALKNNFRITTSTGQCVGDACVFVRLSRLGRKVVTQFQTPHNKKPYLFKGDINSPVFQCKKVPPNQTGEEALKCICEPKDDGCSVVESKPDKSCCGQSNSEPACRPKPSKRRSSGKGKRPCCPANKGCPTKCW